MHTRTESKYKSFVDSVYIQNRITASALYVKMCHYYCLMPKPTVEMSYAYKDEIWVQIICDSFHLKPNFWHPCLLNCVMITVWCPHWHSGDVICIQGRDLSTNHLWYVYPKPYYSPPRMSKCVMITVWCHHRHSGDVICIQGRNLSTNHLFILFIQNPISINSPITVHPVCQNVLRLLCLMPTPTVEMSYAYKDEIWVQIICWFCLSKTLLQSDPYVKMYHYYCLMPTPTVEMSYAYKNEIWVQIICDSVYPKPTFCQPCFLNCVRITVWCHHQHSGDVICIQGRDLSTNHLWLCLSKTLLQSAPYVKMFHYFCLMPTPTVEMSYAYKDEI
jgi:hypothetical protein